jgi:hypothetical protein
LLFIRGADRRCWHATHGTYAYAAQRQPPPHAPTAAATRLRGPSYSSRGQPLHRCYSSLEELADVGVGGDVSRRAPLQVCRHWIDTRQAQQVLQQTNLRVFRRAVQRVAPPEAPPLSQTETAARREGGGGALATESVDTMLPSVRQQLGARVPHPASWSPIMTSAPSSSTAAFTIARFPLCARHFV